MSPSTANGKKRAPAGFGAVINDLHKGRDSGDTWQWLIDISAVLLAFVSLTGYLIYAIWVE